MEPLEPDAPPFAALATLVADGGMVVLTGAGVSTDSGIPAYRDADGRPRHADPMTYQRFVGDADERRRYWARSHVGWPLVRGARPNAVHAALSGWQRAGLVERLVTQNVDGLHTAAGSRDVIDLHGRLDTVVCLDCQDRRPRLELALRLDVVNRGFTATPVATPSSRPDGDVVLDASRIAGFRTVDCRRCGGMLKPDVVFFGEHVPRGRFHAALAHLDRARALVVLGSSLAVGSGYRMVTAARRRGLPVAIVTRGVTRADHLATLRIDAPLAPTVAAVAAHLAGRWTSQPAAPPVTCHDASRSEGAITMPSPNSPMA